MEPQRSPSLRINHFEKQQQNEHGTQRHKRNPKYELLNCAKKFWISKGLTENEEFPNESVLTNTARFPHYERRKTTRGAVKRSTMRQTRRTSTPKFQRGRRRRAKIAAMMEPLVSPLATASPLRKHRDSKPATEKHQKHGGPTHNKTKIPRPKPLNVSQTEKHQHIENGIRSTTRRSM